MGSIEDKKNKICQGNLIEGSPYPFPLNQVISMTDTGRIKKTDRKTAEVQGFFDDVAGRPRNVSHDSTIFIKKAIKQAGLSCIGLPDNQHGNPFPQNTSIIKAR